MKNNSLIKDKKQGIELLEPQNAHLSSDFVVVLAGYVLLQLCDCDP